MSHKFISSILLFVIFGFFNSANAQQILTGTTTDNNGSSLPFVNILIESLSVGTTSDIDGKYTLEIPNQEDLVISFSYIGYSTLTVAYTGQSSIDAVLLEDSELLDEVVVVGYGVQRKSDVVGAVSSIVVDDAKIIPTTNIAEMLRGKSAGVQVTLTDPSPGGSSSILIRGKSTISGSNAPLFVVDGVPVDDINDINSEDIASMEILKDAASQAIYGARASNGVILITTKRGTTGRLKISYHGYRSTQKLVRNFDLYSGKEWVALRREAYRSESGRYDENGNEEYEPDDFVFTQEQIQILKEIESGERDYLNWEDEVINDATQQSHSLSFSAGSDKTSFYAGFGYFDQKGIISNSGYKRATARLNIDHKVSERFSFGTNISMSTDKKDIRDGSLNFITLPPIARLYDDNGEILRYPTGEIEKTSPLWDSRESENEIFSNKVQLNIFGQYEFFDDFTYKLSATASIRNVYGGSYKSRLHSNAFAVNGKGSVFEGNKQDYLLENIFNYNLDINDSHRMDFTFVQSSNSRSLDYYKSSATDFPNDLLGYHGIHTAATILPIERRPNTNTSFPFERQLLSFMGRARYYLNDKYIVTLTSRRDASSVFGPDNKWGFFPSVAVGWKAHLEPFIQKINVINELKFRASYGSVGNEGIRPYTTIGLAQSKNYIFDGAVYGGYSPGTSLFNPNLKWEESSTFNFGVDFGFFKNYIVGSFEFYNTKTKDLLLNESVPGSTGYKDILNNIGNLQNRGIELGITADLIRNADIEWSLITSFASNKTKILKLTNEVDSMGNFVDDISRKRFIGQPIDVIYDYQYDGIWSSQEEIDNSAFDEGIKEDFRLGDIRVKDIDGNGKIDGDDRVIVHKDPDWYGSLGTKFSFLGFDIYAELYHVAGAVKYNNYLAGFNEGGSLQGVLNGIKVNYWTPENTTGTYPRPRRNEFPSFLGTTAISDASYTRLRTVSLAYHLPKTWIKKLNLSDVTIYGTATNLVTWTDFLSYSPETTVGAYPDGKNFVFGVKITN